MTTGSTVRNTLKWTSAFLLWQDTGHKRHPRSLPPIGHHPFWRINMIQSNNRSFANNRSFKNKPLSNIQQAQFSIGWRFCPVCGNKLYKKIDGCSGTLQVKCSKCKETLRLDLAFRRRWFSSHFNKYGCIAPWIWTVRSEQRAIAARQCMKRAPNSRATADWEIFFEDPSVGCCPAIFLAFRKPAPVKRSRLYVCPFFVDAPSGEISVAFQIFDFLRFIENLEVYDVF